MSRAKKDTVAAALGKMESLSVSETASTLTAASGEPVLTMKEKAALKKAARVAERESKKKEDAAAAAAGPVDVKKALAAGTALPGMNEQQQLNAAARQATGVLITEKRARDIKISGFSLSLHSTRLVEDTILELSWGQRYGLIGRNGCGKSTMLQCIAAKEVPIPAHIDTYLLAEEAQPSDMSALQYVIDSAQKEYARLEALGEHVLAEEGPDSEMLMEIYDRQGELDPATFESRASSILCGLGFDAKTLHKRTRDMSGGWRMRVALARALFIKPALLLLDEPTNHLDLAACVWLEDYLGKYPNILVVVSHSQDFLNGVCNNIMVMQDRKLRTWSGNYDMYIQTRGEQDAAQEKEYKKQQEYIKETKEFIASCGTYANLVRQAKSRQKILDKMYEAGLVKLPFKDPVFKFKFPETGKLPPPLISFNEVAFSYSGKKEDYLFSGLSFGIDSDSRIALVGPNGAGKSTLLKLFVGENRPTEGNISLRPGMVIGRYHQHSAEVLDPEATPVEYVERKFKERLGDKGQQEWRSLVGSFGIPSSHHLEKIKTMSEGLKHRLVLAEIAMQKPHLLLFDEPTNASDLEGVDALAEAINAYEGGVVVISHDFRLLSQILDNPSNPGQIWVVDHGIKRWEQEGGIRSYKAFLKKSMAL